MSGDDEPAKVDAEVELRKRDAYSAEGGGGLQPTIDSIPALVAGFLA